MRRVEARPLLPQANRKRSLIFGFFEVASRSVKIWTGPEWVVQRRELGLG